MNNKHWWVPAWVALILLLILMNGCKKPAPAMTHASGIPAGLKNGKQMPDGTRITQTDNNVEIIGDDQHIESGSIKLSEDSTLLTCAEDQTCTVTKQLTTGNCGATISNVRGNITITCDPGEDIFQVSDLPAKKRKP